MNIFKNPPKQDTSTAAVLPRTPEDSYPGLPAGYSDPAGKFFVHEELRALYAAAPTLPWKQAQEDAESIARREVNDEFKARDDARRAEAREAGRSGKFEIDMTARAMDVRNIATERMDEPEPYFALARHFAALRYAAQEHRRLKEKAAVRAAHRQRATCSVCGEEALSTTTRYKTALGHAPGSYRACLRCFEGIEQRRAARRSATVSPELAVVLDAFAADLPEF